MKEQSSIPTSKVERASRFVSTGLKVGTNYIKHYTRKLIDPSTTKDALHEDNAEDIYNTLSNLKGSALKAAQMLSMDKGLLPRAYTDKFAMSQYSAPPLSGPLVVNTFQKTLGKTPSALFDTFELKASNAASIGQVHKATLAGKTLAVKIQYPGVAHSVRSDLRLIKPFAMRIAGLSEVDMDQYFEEIESKLLEETDYHLELERSIELSAHCAHIPNLVFPRYYPALSSDRIITMDWLPGLHLKEFLQTNPSQEVRNKIGQALWDFYQFQMHSLRKVHADPHPGNFLMQPDGRLGIFDFGCVKEIPENFYYNYFQLTDPEVLKDETRRRKVYRELEMIHDNDSEQDILFYAGLFQHLIDLLTIPFRQEHFDFGNDAYFQEMYDYVEYLSNLKELKESKVARGSRHSLYVNRTYFGLYTLLNDLRAQVITGQERIGKFMQR
ncbi:ABC1 family protein [Chitinophaga costaii]|uniref:ABC1 family protein n=1 Tax=Chitinophaga costaii TaxID=1335309 RepID=A0A1C4EIX1_9BACT|nr:AarF/ABC1/UbiB kinase family protein [Chitinophaga costaii]PUZ23795.1 ABC transporter [Chitinophaga costaii]SCC43470.1 ABC1 family protein [Chitinophaga costaii]